MKKGLVAVLAVIAFLSFSTISSAALLKGNISRGNITAVNPAEGTVTILDYTTGKNETFTVGSVAGQYKLGQRVIIRVHNGKTTIRLTKRQ